MLPHLIGRRGPGQYIPSTPGGGGTGVGDGGFVEPPVVTTTASGNTTITGKVKAGSFGKFVLPLATIAAGRQYTFRYTPQFSQLAQQGKLAMVGFGLKNNNDFHIVGLRGDGSTGIHKYKVNGTPPNGWNKDTGHTTSDGGAAANGSQAGPNYIRLVVSADGATYTFQTSPDGVTWTDEYTGQTPTPFSNASGVATFGIALWFNNADAGPFSIVIDQFVDAVVTGTLNPSDKSASITLSGGNLTATKASGAAWVSVRSQTSHTGGKYYWEWSVIIKGVNNGLAGFANATESLANFIGVDANGISVVTDGEVFKNGAGTFYLSPINNGSIVGIAVDLTNNLFWARNGSGNWNGNASYDPATGVGGIALPTGIASGAVFAGISVYNAADSSAANFGASAFSQTIPSGFTAWG